jgi:glycosyltransferase involved in cell wall biosynthesis
MQAPTPTPDRRHAPSVSIILPTYNRAHLIEAAIRSITAQTYRDFELIVVDDGSTDDTRGRVTAFADARILYLQQEHRGISAALNRGLQTARGRFIARLDSDDIWLPSLLDFQLAMLRDSGAGVVYARAQGMDRSAIVINDFRGLPPRYPHSTIASLLYGDMTCNITTVAHRGCLDAAGPYDESLTVNEDWHMWLRVALHCAFAFNDRVLARYRYHEGNITGAASAELTAHLDGRVGVLDRFYTLPDLPPEALAMRPLAYRNAYLWSAHCWLGLGRHGCALRTYARAFRVPGHRLDTVARTLWSFGSALLRVLPVGHIQTGALYKVLRSRTGRS